MAATGALGAPAALAQEQPALVARAPIAQGPPRPPLHVAFGGHASVRGHMSAARRRLVHDRLVSRAWRLERRLARLRDRRAPGARRRGALVRLHTAELQARVRALRLRLSRSGFPPAQGAVPVPPVLQAIAACESGGDPRAIGGGGLYRGKYQFDRATWAAVGGSGDPAAASEGEQDRRAAMLYARAGTSPWPVCGG